MLTEADQEQIHCFQCAPKWVAGVWGREAFSQWSNQNDCYRQTLLLQRTLPELSGSLLFIAILPQRTQRNSECLMPLMHVVSSVAPWGQSLLELHQKSMPHCRGWDQTQRAWQAWRRKGRSSQHKWKQWSKRRRTESIANISLWSLILG